MSELQTEYASQAEFNVIAAEETLKRTEEVNGFGFEALKHGMVLFDKKGEVVAKLPGHSFGKPEIEAALKQALGTN